MPLWTVEGADKATGKDVVWSVDAPTEDLARSAAIDMGILVAEIHRSAADPLEQLSVAVQAAVAPQSDSPATLNYSTVKKNPSTPLIPTATVTPPPLEYPTTPEYPDIIKGAKWLRTIAMVLWIIGWMYIAYAAIALVVSLGSPFISVNTAAFSISIPEAVSTIAFGSLYLAAASLLRLGASVAVVLRDMARNSFRQ